MMGKANLQDCWTGSIITEWLGDLHVIFAVHDESPTPQKVTDHPVLHAMRRTICINLQ